MSTLLLMSPNSAPKLMSIVLYTLTVSNRKHTQCRWGSDPVIVCKEKRMKARVRHFISPDVDLDNFRPDDPSNFSFLLQALVGPADAEGEESVQFVVTTPRALADQVQADGVVFGRSLVIVGTPDIPRVPEAVRRAIERLEEPSWSHLCRRLQLIGIHEFEDHS